MPRIGTLTFTMTSNTPPKLHASEMRGSVSDRSTNRKASPAMMRAIDPRPIAQAIVRALRAVTAFPSKVDSDSTRAILQRRHSSEAVRIA